MADPTISLAPIVQTLLPYVLAGVGSLITVVFGWMTYLLKKKFNIDIDAGMREALQTAATNGAAKVIAGLQGNFENMKIDVGSPLVAEAIRYVEAHAPDAIKHFGVNESTLADLVLAKLGAAQIASNPIPDQLKLVQAK